MIPTIEEFWNPLVKNRVVGLAIITRNSIIVDTHDCSINNIKKHSHCQLVTLSLPTIENMAVIFVETFAIFKLKILPTEIPSHVILTLVCIMQSFMEYKNISYPNRIYYKNCLYGGIKFYYCTLNYRVIDIVHV